MGIDGGDSIRVAIEKTVFDPSSGINALLYCIASTGILIIFQSSDNCKNPENGGVCFQVSIGTMKLKSPAIHSMWIRWQ
jgi:hypothetical protein